MSLQQSAWGARHATGCEAHICGPCMQQGYQHLPVPTGLLHKRQPGLGSSWPRSPFPPFQDTPVSPQRWARCCTLNRMPPPRRAGPSHTHTCQCEGCDACLHAVVVASVVHSRRDAVLDAGRVKLAGGCAGLDVGPAASTGKVGYARYTGQRSSKRAASGRHALLEWQGRLAAAGPAALAMRTQNQGKVVKEPCGTPPFWAVLSHSLKLGHPPHEDPAQGIHVRPSARGHAAQASRACNTGTWAARLQLPTCLPMFTQGMASHPSRCRLGSGAMGTHRCSASGMARSRSL